MPTFYGPPSDGTVIPQQLEDALVADVGAPGSPLRAAFDDAGYVHAERVEAEYIEAWGDADGKVALGIRDDGVVEVGGAEVAVKGALKRTAWVLTVSGGTGALTGEDSRPSVTARIPFSSGADFRVKAIHVRNYNDRSGLAYSGALNFSGVYFGEHAQDTSGALTGNFVSAPTQLSEPFSTPADGSTVTIPVDIAVKAGEEYLFSYGYDKDGTANHQGIGGCWTTDASSDVSATTVTGRQSKFAPLDLWFEIETEAPVVAWMGDSLSCGVGAELPVYQSVPMIHGRANRYVPLMYTHSGSLMTSWTNHLAVKYTKWAGLDKPGALVFSLGKNDLINATDTATLRARFADVYGDAAAFASSNLFLTTVIPSDDDSTTSAGTVRREWNEILRNELLGNARMLFDFSAVVSDPGTGNLLPAFDSGDGTHLNKRGYMELARAVNQTL